MEVIFWLITFVFAWIIGFFLIQCLVRPPEKMGWYGALLALASAALLLTLVRSFRGIDFLLAGLVILVGFVLGYIIANAAFLAKKVVRRLPEIQRRDGGDGHTAILYFTHGEPPGYSAQPWVDTIREFDRDKVPFIPWLIRPIFFNTVRREYLAAGGSAHNQIHQIIIDNLKRAMPDEVQKGARFYLSFLENNPYPDEMAIRAINEGASRIVILPVFITESSHTEEGKKMVSSVAPEKYGVQTFYTGALWDSETLQYSFVERTNEMLNGLDKSKVGILLVGYGQPTQWENIFPAQNRQEIQYRESIRDKLLSDGFSPELVVLGWMDFQEPSITAMLKELAAKGVEKILVLGTSLSADSIHTGTKIPLAIEKARLPDEIPVEFLRQYGDHPLAIQAMKEKIATCIN